MSFGVESSSGLGFIEVGGSPDGRGLNADELTAMAMRRILFVADSAPPAIRDQAEAFKSRIEAIVRQYIAQAQKSEHTTICGVLEQAGMVNAAALVRKL